MGDEVMVSSSPEASLKLEAGSACGMVAEELEHNGVWSCRERNVGQEEQSQREKR
jgi:hypothetical protein